MDRFHCAILCHILDADTDDRSLGSTRNRRTHPMKPSIMTELKARNFRVEVALLGSGWAAVMTAEYADMNWNRDVVQTGVGRYATQDGAIAEAKTWAQEEKVEFLQP